MTTHNDDKPHRQTRITAESDFDPYEVNRPIPIAVLSVAFALAVWGVATLWDDYDAQENASAEISETEIASIMPNGATLFAANCQTCHQANGLGISEAVPPLAGSRYVTADGRVPAHILVSGITGPIAVRDKLYDGRMPAFGDTLNDAQIAAILTHIRSQWGNDAGEVSAEMVAAARAARPAAAGPLRGGAEIETLTGVSARLPAAASATPTEIDQ